MAKKKVLVIDDEADIAATVKFLLELRNYQVIVAEDGYKGINMAQESKPDLILLDVMMPPGMDGFETCRRLKANDETQDIPIIMFTAKGESDSVEEAINAGATGYIVKPFNPTVLLDKIKQAVS